MLLPVLLILFGLAGSMIFSGSFMALYQAIQETDGSEAAIGPLFAGLAGVWLGLGGAAVFALSKHVDLGFKFKAQDLGLGVLVGLAGQLIVYLIYLPASIVAPELVDDVGGPAQKLTELASGWLIVPFVFAVCGISPFVEELFFRGLVLKTFLAKFGSVTALTVSSLLFGFVHLQGIQLPALILFGALLGFTALKTGRLGPSIVGHMIFNLTTVGINIALN